MGLLSSFVQTTRDRRVLLATESLRRGNALVGTGCLACSRPFLEDEPVAFVVLGPGDAEEDQRRWKDGAPVNAPAVFVHVACAGLFGGAES